MQRSSEAAEVTGLIAGIAGRYAALRQAAALPGADPGALLDAVFTELEGAIDALAESQGHVPATAPGRRPQTGADSAERRLLRAAFTDAPVALFLLATDGTVQRVNKAAAEVLGSQPGYATGRPFTTFVTLQSRAAVHTQLTAVARTARNRTVSCRLLSASGPVPAELVAGLVSVRGDADQLIVAVREQAGGSAADGGRAAASGPDGGRAQSPGSSANRPGRGARPRTGTAAGRSPAASADGRPAGAAPLADGGAARGGSGPAGPTAGSGTAVRAVEAMAHRMDLVTAVTRLLLENENFSESTTLQRCASLLSGGLAAWVIVDLERRNRLRRQFVIGPADHAAAAVVRAVSAVDPDPGSLPGQVFQSGRPVLITHPADPAVLGTDRDGVPLQALMESSSVLSVPLADGEQRYGVLTMSRRPPEGQFELADLGLVEELGSQLGLAIRVDRMFRRRTEIADALQASLLPRRLPEVPGVELAATYVAATEGTDVGGDFYDVYRTPAGFGVAVGDVCGKGEEAAAVTAAARHAIRVIAHGVAVPDQVLTRVNDIMLAEELNGGFVTTHIGHFRWRGRQLHGELCSAGHPGPVLIRADGRTEVTRGGGLPVGLFADPQTGRDDVQLGRGDLLFFFTDGVTEARSPDRQCFEDRLCSELAGLAGGRPADVVAAMQRLVLEFSAHSLADDMTMLALRVGDPP